MSLFSRLGDIEVPSKSVKYLGLAIATFLVPSLVGILWIVMAFEPVWSKNSAVGLAFRQGQKLGGVEVKEGKSEPVKEVEKKGGTST